MTNGSRQQFSTHVKPSPSRARPTARDDPSEPSSSAMALWSPRREPSTDPGAAERLGSPDSDGTSSARVPVSGNRGRGRRGIVMGFERGFGSESTLGVVVDSTIAEPNDVFVDWGRRSPVGQPTLEEKLVLGPDGDLHRGPPMDMGGRCGSVMATTNHNPPHRKRTTR